jgi:MFS family permease
MESILPSLRGLPRTFWLLWVGALINRLGGFVMTFLALYLTGVRGLSVAAAGTVVSLWGLGGFVAAPVGGILADRWGRRPTLLLSLFTAPLALALLYVANTPATIAAAAVVYGFFSDLFRPANQAMIADVVGPQDRTRAFGILYWAINLGFAVAAIAGGTLAEHGYGWLFGLDGTTTAACGLLIALTIAETRPVVMAPPAGADPQDQVAPTRRPWADLGVPLRDLQFVALCGLSIVWATVFQQFFVALPIDMRAHGVSAKSYGLLMSLNGILIITLQPFVLNHLGRLRRSQVLALGATLVGLGLGLNGVAHSAPWYALSIGVWTLGEIVQVPVLFAVIADLSPPASRGVYQGVFGMTWSSAMVVGPALGAAVLSHFGASVLWSGCLVAGLLVALGQLTLARPRGVRLGLTPPID